MEKLDSSYDLVVVGAGVFGLSTAAFLATHYPQLRIALIEQFKIGHLQGSSHSQIRIIRSVYANPFYRDLCVEGIEKYWKEVETLCGDKFIEPNPFLMFLETQQLFREMEANAKASNGQMEVLSTEQTYKRFPSAPVIAQPHWTIYDSKAGVVMAQKYISKMAAFLRQCKQITILEETMLTGFSNNAEGVVLQISNQSGPRTIGCKKVALSCGRWIMKLVPEVKGLLKEVKQTVGFLEMKQPAEYGMGSFPCWVHHRKDGTEYYGLPDVNEDGLKVGFHAIHHDYLNKLGSEQTYNKFMKQLYIEKAEQYFKGKVKQIKKFEPCYYTVSQDEEFLIDWTDRHDNVLVVSPCSGHGFKFGPIIGKVVADLLVKDQSIAVFEKYRHFVRMFYHLGVKL